MRHALMGVGFLLAAAWCGGAPAPDQVREIVRRSIENTNADWKTAPQYDFTETDVVTKHGQRIVKTLRVTMMDGSPYEKVIAMNGEPLSGAQAEAEEQKMRQEEARRKAETPSVRQS